MFFSSKKAVVLDTWLGIKLAIYVAFVLLIWLIRASMTMDELLWSELLFVTLVYAVNATGTILLGMGQRWGLMLSFIVSLLSLVGVLWLGNILVFPFFLCLVLNVATWGLLTFGNDSLVFLDGRAKESLAQKLLVGAASVFVVVSIAGIRGFTMESHHSISQESGFEAQYAQMSDEDLLKELDEASISLAQIAAIEKRVSNIPKEQQIRIKALRHILVGYIVQPSPDLNAFKDAYYFRKDDLSNKQQEVLEWFFMQQQDVRQMWESVGMGAMSFADFQQKVRTKMKERNLTELK